MVEDTIADRFCEALKAAHPQVKVWLVNLELGEVRACIRCSSDDRPHNILDEWPVEDELPDDQVALTKLIANKLGGRWSVPTALLAGPHCPPAAAVIVAHQLPRLPETPPQSAGKSMNAAWRGFTPQQAAVFAGLQKQLKSCSPERDWDIETQLTGLISQQIDTNDEVQILKLLVQTMRDCGLAINSPYDFENWITDHARHSDLFLTGLFKEED